MIQIAASAKEPKKIISLQTIKKGRSITRRSPRVIMFQRAVLSDLPLQTPMTGSSMWIRMILIRSTTEGKLYRIRRCSGSRRHAWKSNWLSKVKERRTLMRLKRSMDILSVPLKQSLALLIRLSYDLLYLIKQSASVKVLSLIAHHLPLPRPHYCSLCRPTVTYIWGEGSLWHISSFWHRKHGKPLCWGRHRFISGHPERRTD